MECVPRTVTELDCNTVLRLGSWWLQHYGHRHTEVVPLFLGCGVLGSRSECGCGLSGCGCAKYWVGVWKSF